MPAEIFNKEALLDPLSRDTVDQQLVQWKALDLPEVSDAGDTVEATAPEEPAAEEAVEDTEAEDSE